MADDPKRGFDPAELFGDPEAGAEFTRIVDAFFRGLPRTPGSAPADPGEEARRRGLLEKYKAAKAGGAAPVAPGPPPAPPPPLRSFAPPSGPSPLPPLKPLPPPGKGERHG